MSNTTSPALIPFQPSATTPFTFQAVGSTGTYTGIVTWSLAGQRYYLNLYTLGGAPVSSMAMVGSPVGYDIDLTYGQIAPDSIVFRTSTGNFEVNSG